MRETKGGGGRKGGGGQIQEETGKEETKLRRNGKAWEKDNPGRNREMGHEN